MVSYYELYGAVYLVNLVFHAFCDFSKTSCMSFFSKHTHHLSLVQNSKTAETDSSYLPGKKCSKLQQGDSPARGNIPRMEAWN